MAAAAYILRSIQMTDNKNKTCSQCGCNHAQRHHYHFVLNTGADRELARMRRILHDWGVIAGFVLTEVSDDSFTS